MKESKKLGRPTKRSPDVIQRIVDGLSNGVPLTVICAEKGMPDDNTVRDWMRTDAELSGAIARAREAGFDRIALEALAIADNTQNDTVLTDKGGEVPNSEWISRSRLRVETRLKLLAKWDPKRYGDKPEVVVNNAVAVQNNTGEQSTEKTLEEIKRFRERWNATT